MTYFETTDNVSQRMHAVNARCMWQMKGPRDTLIAMIEMWQVGYTLVMVQYYKDGGCAHFVQNTGTTWDSLEADLQRLKVD